MSPFSGGEELAINYSKFTIVLPTLNERRTVGELVRYMQRNYRGCSVLVMDDGSTDGTKEIVNEISKEDRRVRFVDRKAMGLKRGLTASIVDGIARSVTRYVVVIDADMQHPPGKIRDVALALNRGNDLVVANRANVTDWALYRRLISRSLMYIGRFVLFAGRKETCDDIFSGYFGVKRELFVSVYRKNRRRFVGAGYKALFDFLKCVDRGTLRIASVPFVFNVRHYGASKAGVGQGLALVRSFLS